VTGRGLRRGLLFLGVFCAVGPRTRGFSHVALPASANAGFAGWNSGRNPWRAFGSFFVVGLAAGYKRCAVHEGMGMGDVKMMAMIGALLGLRGDVPDASGREPSGSVIGIGLIVALYSGVGGAEWRAREPPGTGDERQLRWAIARRYQLPRARFWDWGAGDRVWGTADCRFCLASRDRP